MILRKFDFERYKDDKNLMLFSLDLFTELNIHFKNTILTCYYEPHRYLHNYENHISKLLNEIYRSHYFPKNNSDKFSYTDCEKLELLVLGTWFHDIVYVPVSKINEEASVKFMKDCFKKYMSGISELNITILTQIILDTKEHNPKKENELSCFFSKIDMQDLYAIKTIPQYQEDEYLIFKEYQAVPYDISKKNRLYFLNEVLEKLQTIERDGTDPYIDYKLDSIKARISIVESFKPKIGIYAGTFNPFTTGHNNILQKARKDFDKVIVAFCKNQNKSNTEFTFVENGMIKNSFELLSENYLDLEIVIVDSEKYPFITDYINYIEGISGTECTLIRGLRNGDDLNYEENYIAVLKDIKPEIHTVFYLCDIEFKHISSTLVRGVSAISTQIAKKYFVV